MFHPFIIENKLTSKKYMVIQYYEKRYTGVYLLVDMDTMLLSVIDEGKLRQGYKFGGFYAK